MGTLRDFYFFKNYLFRSYIRVCLKWSKNRRVDTI